MAITSWTARHNMDAAIDHGCLVVLESHWTMRVGEQRVHQCLPTCLCMCTIICPAQLAGRCSDT